MTSFPLSQVVNIDTAFSPKLLCRSTTLAVKNLFLGPTIFLRESTFLAPGAAWPRATQFGPTPEQQHIEPNNRHTHAHTHTRQQYLLTKLRKRFCQRTQVRLFNRRHCVTLCHWPTSARNACPCNNTHRLFLRRNRSYFKRLIRCGTRNGTYRQCANLVYQILAQPGCSAGMDLRYALKTKWSNCSHDIFTEFAISRPNS